MEIPSFLAINLSSSLFRVTLLTLMVLTSYLIDLNINWIYRHPPSSLRQARRKHFGSGAAIGTKKTAGGLGGAVSPQRVQGRALVGAEGAKPPEAP